MAAINPAALLIIFSLCTLAFVITFYVANNALGTAIIEREIPPLEAGNGLEISEDSADRDIQIDMSKFQDEDGEDNDLGENRTEMISTRGADDLDIEGLPPKGFSLIVTNETAIITKNPVRIQMSDLESDIRDELIDAAREQSNNTVHFDLPPDYPIERLTLAEPPGAQGSLLDEPDEPEPDSEENTTTDEQDEEENN
jgi:hypothetical protein